MTYEEQENDLQQYWDRGWNDYWKGVNQNDCPTYLVQAIRDEWLLGWLTAQEAAEYEADLYRGV